MNMDNIAKHFKIGDKCKYYFGSPANNHFKCGVYQGRDKKGLGMIQIEWAKKMIVVKRPMDEIFPV